MAEKKPKQLSQEEYYEKFFQDKDGEEIKCKKKEALNYALDIRKFEIELYWKRAAYFWTFISVTMAGFIVAQKIGEGDKAYLSVIISCLGFVFSFAWFYVNKGSKYWQEN